MLGSIRACRMHCMERIFSVTLSNGRVTEVYKADGFEDLRAFLGTLPSGLIVTDDNVIKAFDGGSSLVLEHGEANKRWESIDMILSSALGKGLARDSFFIGIGGGVICDMAGFSSSLYMRGSRLILVPTSLLCMVDATLGGKTGIDYMGGKNLVGSFYPAEKVIISMDFIDTLPECEFRSGMGEVIKHAFLSEDDRLLSFLSRNRERIEARDKKTLEEMLILSLEVKISYISKDPEEKLGIREALNLGHTFAHALETYSDYTISHGEAVAWGTGKALEAGFRLGITPESMYRSGIRLLDEYGYGAISVQEDRYSVFENAIGKDKKKKKGEVRFVLMEAQGKHRLMPLEKDFIRSIVL